MRWLELIKQINERGFFVRFEIEEFTRNHILLITGHGIKPRSFPASDVGLMKAEEESRSIKVRR